MRNAVPFLLGEPPFVGRTGELAELSGLAGRALGGAGDMVALTGESGIGKSALIARFQLHVTDLGMASVVVRSSTIARAPRTLWTDVLAQFADIAGGVSGVPLEGQLNDPYDVAETLSAVAASACERAPMLLVIEDAHLCSQADVEVLSYVGRWVRERPLLVIVVAQTVSVRAGASPTPLHAWLRESRLAQTRLGPLGEAEVEAYLRACLPVEPHPSLVRDVTRRTDGNPFYLAELVPLLATPGASASAVLEEIPVGVRDLVRYRVESLPEACQRLLSFSAVAVEPIRSDIVADAAGLDRVEALQLFALLLRAGILVDGARAGEFRFAHVMFCEAAYDAISSVERLLINAALGDALRRRVDGAPEYFAVLAEHFSEAASLGAEYAQDAVHYGVLAARSAYAGAAWEQAASLYGRALSVIDLYLPRDGRAVDLLIEQGKAWQHAGEWNDAWRCFKSAVNRCRATDDARIGVATLAALDGMDPPRALRVRMARAALDSLGSAAPRVRARLLVQLAGLASDDEANAASLHAQQLAEQHGFADVRAELELRAVRIALGRGDVAEALRISSERVRELRQRGSRVELGQSLSVLAEVWSRAGDLRRSLAAADEGLRLAAEERDRPTEQFLLYLTMSILATRGERDAFEQALGATWYRAMTRLIHAREAEMRGDLPEALRRMPGRAEPGIDHPRLSWKLHGQMARLLVTKGDLERAQGELVRWEARRAGNSHPTDPQDAFAAAGEALVALAPDHVLQSLYEEALSWSSVKFSYLTATSLDRVRGLIAMRLGDLGAARRLLEAARVWAADEGAHYEQVRALAALAEVAHAAHDERQAMAYEDEARRVASQRGIPLPGAGEAAARSAGSGLRAAGARVSDRELEVLRLVAHGRTNQQIALALDISPHTVSRHISNIIGKMGVSNRAEAVSMAMQVGLI